MHSGIFGRMAGGFKTGAKLLFETNDVSSWYDDTISLNEYSHLFV